VNLLRRLFGKPGATETSVQKEDEASCSPGWDFIEQLFAELYPGQRPRHAAPTIAPEYDLRPGRAPIEGTHVYDAGLAWHYITLGLSDLHEKTLPESPMSGIGCELSMRVHKRGNLQPPLWPAAFLGTIASFVDEGAAFGPGTSFRTGPVPGAPPSADLHGAIALSDPQLPSQIGPFGGLEVVLLVGLTRFQLDQIQHGGGAALAAEIAADPAKWLT